MSSPSRQSEGREYFTEVPFLVVEDDPPSARLVATMLAIEGSTHVRVAHSAEEALGVLRSEFVGVLIVDVRLPGMDGLVLVRRVKNEPATRHIVAVAMSGADEPDLGKEAIDSGCIALVRKPIEFEKLFAILRASLAPGPGSAGLARSGRES